VRDLAVSLDAEPRIARYDVAAENFESIHNHSAYAQIERGERVSMTQHSIDGQTRAARACVVQAA